MRPKSLSKFDKAPEEKLLTVKREKEVGVKVVGLYCAYSPREMVMAAGAIPVSLCGYKQDPLPAAGRDLPSNLCPVIKTFYDLAATDTCPYFHFCDVLFAQTTCDGRKKAYELMRRLKPLHVMDLPQKPDRKSALDYWRSEIVLLKKFLEESLSTVITEEEMRKAIRKVNRETRILKRLFDCNKRIPAPLNGKDLLQIMSVTGYSDVYSIGIKLAEELLEEIEEDAEGIFRACSDGAPRILLTGVPIGVETGKIVELVEEGGGIVVAMENCGGYKTVEQVIDESDTRDAISLLSEKYFEIPCSVMSPNDGRMDLLARMARDFSVDGVIDLAWCGCHTYNIESSRVSALAKERLKIPFLHLETDFSPSDRETLRNRIDAFLEII